MVQNEYKLKLYTQRDIYFVLEKDKIIRKIEEKSKGI